MSIPISVRWEDLLGDAGVPAVVSDPFSGRIIWANDGFAAIYGKSRRAADLAGCSLTELINDDAATERHAIYREVIRSGTPRLARDLWNGRAMCMTIRPVTAWDDAPSGAVVVTFRPIWPEPVGMAHSPCAGANPLRTTDLGPLAQLSKRELEVLAHIGEGLTNAQIASRLHRTAKTIEAHRTSLAAKLGVGTRVELAAVAARAGLGRTSLPASTTPAPAHHPSRSERAASN